MDFNGRNRYGLVQRVMCFIRPLEMVLESQREILDQVMGKAVVFLVVLASWIGLGSWREAKIKAR